MPFLLLLGQQCRCIKRLHIVARHIFCAVAASTSVDLAEEVGRDYITTAHVAIESAQN